MKRPPPRRSTEPERSRVAAAVRATQIDLAMQTEELRRARAALEEARALYVELCDAARRAEEARKAREGELEQLAFHDALTGLPNRRLMNDRLNQAMAVGARTRREGALMFIDLDNFKEVNDSLGHSSGDLLLQQVARRLTRCLREGDTAARNGGDEFVVMLATDLSDAADEAAAQARAAGTKILAALNHPYEIAGHAYHGGASIGITLFNGHGCAADELLRRADQAMYQAKSDGGNRLRFFEPAAQRQRPALGATLRQAMQHGDFTRPRQADGHREQRLLDAWPCWRQQV